MTIYLDYAATTPVDPAVAEKMSACLTEAGTFGNPASQHSYGQAAMQLVETAREQVANLLHAEAKEIIWTSGATEANNLAIKGIAHLYRSRGHHLVTLKTEHKAVLDPFQQLEKEGYSVTYLSPQKNGLVDLTELASVLTAETILVSIMHVNNETGVIQDLKKIAELTTNKNIFFHVDAAQSPGKVAINLKELPIHLLSICAHKVYGPKGIGALYLRQKPRVRVAPLIHGGGHEQGMRSGTLATHQIVGMGEAFRLAQVAMPEEIKRITQLRERFIRGLSGIACLRLNAEAMTVPHILSIRFEGMVADAILKALPQIAASTASACQGKGTEGSYVLKAMGYSQEQVKSSIRFSLGRMTSEQQVDAAVEMIMKVFNRN